VANERVTKLSASALRTLLITEIQDFIRSLDTGLSVDQLTVKRDFIKEILKSLSHKEGVEFKGLSGKYFPNLDKDGLPEGQVA